MTTADAAKLLDLPADSTPEQLETRFLELRRKLEDKIARAPTPGLQAKYRESLAEITTAFETLTLAADSSSLPVTSKQTSGGPASLRAAPESDPSGLRSQVSLPGDGPDKHRDGSSQQRRGFSPSRPKSGGKELALVSIIAVVLLAAGGWFVMKTRAENAEKARIAAEAQAEKERQAAAAKAEQERLAQVARLEAEQKKQAEEAERVRQEKLLAQLRGDLAEAKITWEAIEREERSAERRLAELKSDLRNLRDVSAGRQAEAQAGLAAQQEYYDWLSDTLSKHPARIARGRAEELVSARQADDAQVVMRELSTTLRALELEIPRQRAALLDLDGELVLKTNADATWSVTDAFGRTRTGKGPADFKDLAVGPAQVKVAKNSWPARAESVVVRRTQVTTLDAVFTGTNVRVATTPVGARAFGPDGKEIGLTPVQLTDLAPGSYQLVLKLTGYYDQPVYFSAPDTAAEIGPVKLRARVTKPIKPEWRVPARFIYETSTSYSTDGNRSTGTFAKDAWRYNNSSSSSSREEWRFSEPDAKGVWSRAERRVLSSMTPQVPVGLRIRYTRQPDGNFSGEFVEGDVTDENYRKAYLTFPSLDSTWGHAWLDDAWPPENTPVGGSWTFAIRPGVPTFFGKAQVTGKLLAFDRTPTADWVTLQFSSDEISKGEAETRNSHTITMRINLGEGYVATVDGSSLNSTTVKAVLIGQIGTDTRGNYSYKLTVQ